MDNAFLCKTFGGIHKEICIELKISSIMIDNFQLNDFAIQHGDVREMHGLDGIIDLCRTESCRCSLTSNFEFIYLFTDFVNGTEFKAKELHFDNVNAMFDDVVTWSTALKTLR